MMAYFFRYVPLPDNRQYFRILELLPGTIQEPLRCRLRIEKLCTPPHYEAISYVWRVSNDGDDYATIQCDGQIEPLVISTNLEHALKSVRYPGTTRLLWADAVCINQRDLTEKTEQVQHMGTIFASASQVIAWLGHASSNYTSLFRFLGEVAARCPAPKPYGAPDHNFQDLDDLLASAQPEEWAMLENLYKTKLFSRIWIVQELNLALSGFLLNAECRLQLSIFKTALFWINKRRPVKVERFKIPWGLLDPYLYLNFVHNDPARPSITDSNVCDPARYVLRSVRNCACTVPHDRIYALLGHDSLKSWVEDVPGRTKIPINYTTPCSEIYLAVASRLLEEPKPLLTLSLVDHKDISWPDEDSKTGCPSWVPNWEVPGRTFFLPNEFRTRYQASTHKSPSFRVSGRNLEIQGCGVDKIIWRSPNIDSSNFRAGLAGLAGKAVDNVILHIWRNLEDNVRCSHQEVGQQYLLKRLCFTLNAGNRILSQETYKDEVTTDQRNADCLAALRQLGVKVECLDSSAQDGLGDCDRFLATTEDLCKDRCFFVTKNGYTGLGPRITVVGDEVCLLYGAQVPFVLHPLHSEASYRLSGECYVHGIMDGQAISNAGEDTIAEKWYTLS